MSRVKKGITRSKGRGRQGRGWSVPRPPQFTPTIRSIHKFRWVVASATSGTVTSDSMLSWYVVATAATTTARPIEAARLRRVSIWGQPPALGAAAVTVALDWKGSQAPDVKHADTSSGITPAYLTTKPPKNASASWWYDNSATNTNLFSFDLPLGATIDCEVEILCPDDSAAISGPATTGASLGRFYGANLIGTGQAASSATTPVGLTALP
jgi:hypothetical protein